MGITVRKALLDDAGFAARIFTVLGPKLKPRIDEGDPRFTEDGLKAAISKGVNYFLAEKDGKAVGLASSIHDYKARGNGYVIFFGVLPEHRHGSVGTRLLESVTAEMKKHGMSSAEAEAHPLNKGSLGALKKAGFSEVDRTRENVRLRKPL